MKTFHIGFYKNRKIYFGISIAILVVGLIFNAIFGTQLDIQFKGGAMIKYSYSGDVSTSQIEKAVEGAVKRNVDVTVNKDVKSVSGSKNNLTLTFAGDNSISLNDQKMVLSALNADYPNAGFTSLQVDSVNPTMGRSFFAKCLVAVLIAFLLLDLYIAGRFRKIGGAAAGLFAIVALLHDVAMVYFTFIFFRIPLNDNFIAVVLTILGYSLNDTVVIYDRIRENRKLMGPKTEYSVLVDTSINQTLTRSLNTAGCTFASIAIVFIVGIVYNLASITTFALPMMVGIVTGCYSSICIAGPLYVMWENRKVRKLAARNAEAKEEKLQSEHAETAAEPEKSKTDGSARQPKAVSPKARKKSSRKKSRKRR
ncbi:MAG: protein translocase subunit SecF [Oscillospiraceae bacterium]|jgi:preprotein translocase subunit SecF|nr:protein translocase subunit SecF [Oscillospiraceae bacterium]